MKVQEMLSVLGDSKADVCVTISLNTHRTYPANQNDIILLKNLISDAKKKLLQDHNKRELINTFFFFDAIQDEIDPNYNLESLHIFISETEKLFFRSSWPTDQQGVFIGQNFTLRPLIKEITRSTEYGIMVLSQSGVRLYKANNDILEEELITDQFPFPENPFLKTAPERVSDAKHIDDRVKEFFNHVDKAVQSTSQLKDHQVLVICAEENYSRLLEVSDNPAKYIGHVKQDYNNVDQHVIIEQAWSFMKNEALRVEENYFQEMNEAVGAGLVVTDIQEIFQASLDGRGDLLLIESDFRQGGKLQNERELILTENKSGTNIIDDLGSLIAMQVFSKNGRCLYVDKIPNSELSPIALKLRY